MAKYTDMPLFIYSACVLHNFIHKYYEIGEIDKDMDSEEDEGNERCADNMTAVQKRMNIATLLWSLLVDNDCSW